MQAAIIALSSSVTILFLLVGLVIGWMVKQYIDETTLPKLHPEMFDEEGNIIPDTIYAVRFENDDFDYEDEEDE
jgi:hypothetical protein